MSKPKILIRPIVKTDFDGLYAIDQSCFPQGVAYTRWELRWFLSRRGALGYVAEVAPEKQMKLKEDRVAGFIVAWLEPRKAGHIITLDIVEAYRRQHIGSELMQKVEEDFKAAGVRVVVLEVSVKNDSAQEFYKRFGYEVSERLRNYYPTGEDAFEMVRWFED